MIYGNAVAIDGGEISLSIQVDGGEVALVNYIDGGEQGVFMPIYPDSYTGPLTVTPSEETQVLQTERLTMPGNVVVEPIPSNYGLITWNGSTLTVS